MSARPPLSSAVSWAVLLLCWSAITSGITAQTAQYQLTGLSAERRAAVMAMNLDVHASQQTLDVFIHHSSELALLQAHGFFPRLVHADLEAWYGARLDSFNGDDPTPAFAQGSMGGYFTFDEVVSVMDQWQAQFPGLLAPKQQIGTSIQGRPIWMWKLSDNVGVDEAEPEVLIDALHHAREPVSMQGLMWFVQQLLLGYGTSSDLTELVNSREFFLIPVVNPDGYVHNTSTNPQGGGMWRKNRRTNTDGSIGVDLNRNYGFMWGADNFGSSGTPSSETFRGTSPFSEPESTALRLFAESRTLALYVSLHTYGAQWFVPPDWSGNNPLAPAREAAYAEHADFLGTLSPGFDAAHVWTWLYPSNGTSGDWMESALFGGGTCMAFSAEIGESTDGFWPSTARILPLSQDTALYLFTLAVRAGVRGEGTAPTVNGTGGASPTAWEPGEIAEIQTSVRNVGMRAGTVTLSVFAVSPGLEIIQGTTSVGPLQPLAAAQAPAMPLMLRVANGVAPGTVVSFEVVATAPDAVSWRHAVVRMVGAGATVPLAEDFESAGAWTVGATGDNASGGVWTRAIPVATSWLSEACNPADDHSPTGTQCFVTGNGVPGGNPAAADLDGTTTLVSPVFDLSQTQQPMLSWWRWFATFGLGNDSLRTEISNDGGATWRTIELINNHQNSWVFRRVRVEDHLPRTNAMRLRFRASDPDGASLCEAAIDDVRIESEGASLSLTKTSGGQIGANLSLALNAPFFAGEPYIAGCSFSAVNGLDTPLGRIGLDDDALFWMVYSTPTLFSGFVGMLDAGGQASAVIAVPPLPALSGLNICTAAITLTNWQISSVSGTTRITLQ